MYIGRNPTTANYPIDLFAGDGTTVSFTMSRSPATANAILVIISGVIQRPIDAYDIVGDQLTFTEAPPAPPSGVVKNVEVLHMGDRVQLSQPADASVGVNQLSDNVKNYRPHTWTGDAVTTDFVLTYVASYANSVLVTLDGVVQEPGVDYGVDVTGLILQFVAAPAFGVKISALLLGVRSVSEVVGNTVKNFVFTSTASQTEYNGLDDNGELLQFAPGNIVVYQQGLRLLEGTDYTDNGGAGITLTVGATLSDIIQIWTVGSWASANHYTKEESDNLYSRKNKNSLINGNFDVWQRNTSFSSNEYTADRWYAWAGTGGTHLVSRQAFTLGQTNVPNHPKYFVRQVLSVVGTNSAGVEQKIEDVRSFNGDQVTISFWSKVGSAISGNVRLVQNFGTGGSPSASVNSALQNIDLTTSWAQYSLTFSVAGVSGKTLGSNIDNFLSVQILIGDDSTAPASTYTLDISQVQIELGQSATEWEQRSIIETTNRCQRYYNKLDVYVKALADTDSDITLPVRMRSTPTVTGGGAGIATTLITNDFWTGNQTAAAAQSLEFDSEL